MPSPAATLEQLAQALARLEAKVDALSRAAPRGRLLSRRAAATYLGIGREAVRDLIADGAIRLTGSRISLAELERYVTEGPRPTPGRARRGSPAPADPAGAIRAITIPRGNQ